ncbi:MAG: 2TM domain-containing protein [Flavobacteriales bacterium]
MPILRKRKKWKRLEKKEEYVQNVKGFYKLFAIAVLSLAVPFIIAIKDSANWNVFLWRLLSCGVFLAVYSLNVFDLFGEEWKRIINKKFKKK